MAEIWTITGANAGSVGAATFSNVQNLTGGTSNDIFDFHSGATISGTANGGGGNNTLLGTNAGATWNITNTNAGNVAGVAFMNIENLTGGSGVDTFKFSAGKGVSGLVNGGAGSNKLDYSLYATAVTVNLATLAATGTGGFASIASLAGGAGSDTLIGPNLASTWNITGTNSGSVGGFSFSSVENLTGGSAADTFKFSNGKSVSGKIDGGGGIDTLDYSLYATGVTVNLGAGTATGTGSIANIENVTGSPASDHITGSSLNNVIKGNGGTDVLNGGSGGADTFFLASSQGSATTVTGAGTDDTLVAPNITNTWNITGSNSGNVNGIVFTAIANLLGGSGTDTFKLTSTGSLSGKVDGGSGGTDTLDYSGRSAAVTVNLASLMATATGGFANIDKLVGSTSNSDKLVGPNLTNTWSITGANSGTVGSFSFSGVENLTGGSGADTFHFSNGKSVSGKIDGGGGTNWLDYSSYTTSVSVDLSANAATGVFGGAFGGIAHIENVRGGTGADTLKGNSSGNVLIGNGGADKIIGGSGRSILIGGSGNDSITGGSGDDIVIGGTTDDDSASAAHDAALAAILTEWQSADPYLMRIAKIKAGVGAGSYKFLFGSTVHDDGNASKLTGGSGKDWFFKGASDTITDLAAGEQVN